MFEIKWKSFIYKSKESLEGMGRNLSSTKVTFPIKSFLFVGSGTVTFAPSSSSIENQLSSSGHHIEVLWFVALNRFWFWVIAKRVSPRVGKPLVL